MCVICTRSWSHTQKRWCEKVSISYFSYVFHTFMFHIFKLIVILNNDNKVNTKCSFKRRFHSLREQTYQTYLPCVQTAPQPRWLFPPWQQRLQSVIPSVSFSRHCGGFLAHSWRVFQHEASQSSRPNPSCGLAFSFFIVEWRPLTLSVPGSCWLGIILQHELWSTRPARVVFV